MATPHKRKRAQRQTAPAMEPRLYTSRQVCEMFQISPSTLYKHISGGTFPPPIKAIGRGNRWPRAQIDALSRGQKVKGDGNTVFNGAELQPPATR